MSHTGIELSIAGLFVGVLVGLTGMGGALVMTPLMILWFHIRPDTAVGTDLAYAFVTKAVGALQHIRQRTVDFFAVRWLSTGSIPGALLGSLMVAILMRHLSLVRANHIISNCLGIVYIIVIVALVSQWFLQRGKTVTPKRHVRKILIGLGLFTGFIVGLTSVGSGSLYIAILAIVYPIPAARLVGTDLTQSVAMAGVAAVAHFAIGTVNLPVLGYLLIGSIPGILIGSKMAVRVPGTLIRALLIVLLCWSSFSMISI